MELEVQGSIRTLGKTFFSLFYITEFKFEVRCDLWGHLEAGRASEATKVPVRGNMHIDTRVIKVADFKYYEVRNRFWDYTQYSL